MVLPDNCPHCVFVFVSPKGTIPPLLKTGDPISDNMSGSGGLKMVVTITSILVVAVLVFIMLMVLKRRRREQRLKRLRGRLGGKTMLQKSDHEHLNCYLSNILSADVPLFFTAAVFYCSTLFAVMLLTSSLLTSQMPKAWLRC